MLCEADNHKPRDGRQLPAPCGSSDGLILLTVPPYFHPEAECPHGLVGGGGEAAPPPSPLHLLCAAVSQLRAFGTAGTLISAVASCAL